MKREEFARSVLSNVVEVLQKKQTSGEDLSGTKLQCLVNWDVRQNLCEYVRLMTRSEVGY